MKLKEQLPIETRQELDRVLAIPSGQRNSVEAEFLAQLDSDYQYNEVLLKNEAEQKKAEDNIKAKVEKGSIKMETGVKKLGELGQLDNSVKTSEGSVAYKTVRKARIIDPTKVPAEYLIVDEPKAKKAALALNGLGELIPGVEVYEEKELANRRY